MLAALVVLLASGLTGSWLFEAKTSDGLLRAKLVLTQTGEDLQGTVEIDRHVLKAEGKTDGAEFRLVFVHADGSGPGHSDRLTLTGKLTGDKLFGNWDDRTSNGAWTGTHE